MSTSVAGLSFVFTLSSPPCFVNKQSRTADKGWSSGLGFDRGLTIPGRKDRLVTKCCTRPRRATSYEHVNEPLGSKKYVEFLD